ncbi:MAG: hypothetical protein OXG08_08950 [Gammaproteobacteria bacterium]|nr:hypothetical protein [Gammaproteobacteria bacterium]
MSKAIELASVLPAMPSVLSLANRKLRLLPMLLLCSLGSMSLAGCSSVLPTQPVTDEPQNQNEVEALSPIAKSIEEYENSLHADAKQQSDQFTALQEKYSILAIRPSPQSADDIRSYVVDPNEYAIRRLDLGDAPPTESTARDEQLLRDRLNDLREQTLESENDED